MRTIGDDGFVYFIKPIGMAGPIKIGCSASPESRLSNLMAWSPWPLEILATVPGKRDLEKRVHEHFACHHSHREWFHPHPDIVRAIERIRAGIPIERAIDLSVATGSIKSIAQTTRTPEVRLRMKYVHSIRWAQDKLRAKGEKGAWATPPDVEAIMSRWHGNTPIVPPTSAEFQRLDEYLADPAAHSVPYVWPRKAAA